MHYLAMMLAIYSLILKSYHILSLDFDHVDDLNCILQAHNIVLIQINEMLMLIIIEYLQHFLTTKGQTASKFYQSLQALLFSNYL